jgi:hypothetical protein
MRKVWRHTISLAVSVSDPSTPDELQVIVLDFFLLFASSSKLSFEMLDGFD